MVFFAQIFVKQWSWLLKQGDWLEMIPIYLTLVWFEVLYKPLRKWHALFRTYVHAYRTYICTDILCVRIVRADTLARIMYALYSARIDIDTLQVKKKYKHYHYELF